MAARNFLHDDRATRPAILAAVIGAHLAVLFIPWPDERRRTSDSIAPSRMVLIPSPARAPPPSPRLSASVEFSAASVDSPPQPSLAPLFLPSESTPTASVMAPPDWKQSGVDAAADAAQKNYRALGPTPEAPRGKQPRSPFGAPPAHTYGEIDQDIDKNPIIWLSANCYVRPQNFKAQPGDPFADVAMTFCNSPVGKLKPKGDLFEHLRKEPTVP